jgi:hypothetical protein
MSPIGIDIAHCTSQIENKLTQMTQINTDGPKCIICGHLCNLCLTCQQPVYLIQVFPAIIFELMTNIIFILICHTQLCATYLQPYQKRVVKPGFSKVDCKH